MSEIKGNIYFIVPYRDWGGAQIYSLAIMKMAQPDWHIEVWLPHGSSTQFLAFLDQIGIHYEFTKHASVFNEVRGIGARLKRQFLRIRSELEVFLRLFSIDRKRSVIHIEAAPWQSWILLSLTSLTGIKTFVTLHNFPPITTLFRKIVSKSRLRFISYLSNLHVFTANRDTKEKFRGWFTDAFWQTIDVTYAGIDPEQISEAEAGPGASEFKDRLTISENDIVVLTVGQFIDRKGRWVLLDAAKQICEKHDNIRFIWLMPELPDEKETRRIDSYGLGDKFTPVLSSSIGGSRPDILRFLHIADIFVLPSYLEGLPIALLEAMATGIPSISTNINAIPEAVIHNETGILVEPGESKKLAEEIVKLANDRELRIKLGSAAKAKILTEFDERSASAIVIRRYEEALNINE